MVGLGDEHSLEWDFLCTSFCLKSAVSGHTFDQSQNNQKLLLIIQRYYRLDYNVSISYVVKAT